MAMASILSQVRSEQGVVALDGGHSTIRKPAGRAVTSGRLFVGYSLEKAARKV
jgi:hypothetical protein